MLVFLEQEDHSKPASRLGPILEETPAPDSECGNYLPIQSSVVYRIISPEGDQGGGGMLRADHVQDGLGPSAPVAEA